MEEKQELVKSQVRLRIISDDDNSMYFVPGVTSFVTVHCEVGGGVSVFQGRNHTGNQHLFDTQVSQCPCCQHSAFTHLCLTIVPTHFSLVLPSW